MFVKSLLVLCRVTFRIIHVKTLKKIFNNAVSYNLGINFSTNDVRSCINLLVYLLRGEAGGIECGVIVSVFVGITFVIHFANFCFCIRVSDGILKIVEEFNFASACVRVIYCKQNFYVIGIGNILLNNAYRRLRFCSHRCKAESDNQNCNREC